MPHIAPFEGPLLESGSLPVSTGTASSSPKKAPLFLLASVNSFVVLHRQPLVLLAVFVFKYGILSQIAVSSFAGAILSFSIPVSVYVLPVSTI